MHFVRMIAQRDRDCARCEEPIYDGDVFARVEQLYEDWCLDCEAYDKAREREP